MTYAGFLKELRKLRGKYRLEAPCQWIRAKKDRYGYCPMVGVARLRDPSAELTSDCGLTPRLRERVLEAADNYTRSRKSQIRRDLLRVLGLKEKEALK